MKNIELLPGERLTLDDQERGAFVTYDGAFRSPRDADALFEILMRDIPFAREQVRMYGRTIEVARETYAVGEPGLRYRYSGIERIAAPWPIVLLPLLDEFEARVGVRPNYALCQRYGDGSVGLGWHADDESDIVPDFPIASVSLGAERDFQMRRKKGPTVLTFALGHGSLLMMRGTTQRYYQHQVPKRASSRTARINLTFRLMRTNDRRGMGA